MDYDATDITSTYDRGRDHGPAFLDLWMNVVSSHVRDRPIKTILDLGCGTGRFSEALAIRFDAEVIGIDPSEKMLAQARTKPSDARIRYEPGRAESIPLPDNSIDLIFMSMIFHHFDSPALPARECRRVLPVENEYREGGTAFLRAGTRERISSYPYVEFFPESRPILEDVLSTSTFGARVFQLDLGIDVVAYRRARSTVRRQLSGGVLPGPVCAGERGLATPHRGAYVDITLTTRHINACWVSHQHLPGPACQTLEERFPLELCRARHLSAAALAPARCSGRVT
jgi:ubiquinone/menaquinone biosynthesis C-methylase UbiE